VKYLSPATSVSIIRCPRDSYRLVWSALTYITALSIPTLFGARKKDAVAAGEAPEGRAVVCRVVRVSGTMRKAEEEAVRRGRRTVVGVRGEGFGGDGALDVLGRVLGDGGGERGGIVDSDVEGEESDWDEDG
jgi:ribonuclease P/MRP protein subunit POP5